jgi:alkylation response protein AidB-like acyl-CoA dehydrogenase
VTKRRPPPETAENGFPKFILEDVRFSRRVDPVSPFLNDQLTEEERMIADAARAFAADKLMPRVTDAYLNEVTDREIFSEMGQAGLLGVTVPEQYGGAEAGYVSYGLVAREVERSIPATAR